MSLYRGLEYRIEVQAPRGGNRSLLERLKQVVRQRRAGGNHKVQLVPETAERLLLWVDQTGKGSGNIFKILQDFGLNGGDRTGCPDVHRE